SRRAAPARPGKGVSENVGEYSRKVCDDGIQSSLNRAKRGNQTPPQLDLKALLSSTKRDSTTYSPRWREIRIPGKVQELSSAAIGYYKVVKENTNLYDMVQDLKGNVRVYHRIRPSFSNEAKTVIDFIGEHGSLVILHPLKPQKFGRKVFQFNRVFGPTATQGNVT
ncbi:kinesin-like protein KIN-14L isoform X3, partial [Fagus crenata]